LPGCPSGQREQTVNLPAIAYGGSNPSPGTARQFHKMRTLAPLAQQAERLHGKEEVCGSIPQGGSKAARRSLAANTQYLVLGIESACAFSSGPKAA
jgi:hypothetical protein